MVYVLLANGFEEIEALGFVDILRRADIDVFTVSVNEDKSATGSHNITVTADIKVNDIVKESMSAVVLPGGMPGTLNLQSDKRVIELIKYAVDNEKYVGAICAAPMVLGELGLLQGRKATCYPGFENKLSGAEATGEKVVIDGQFITSRGAGTMQNFAHCFVSVLKNTEIADKIISDMQY